MANKALVTLAVGDAFHARWTQLVKPNWEAYAARHGYDVICLDAPLDVSARARGRSPAWQKCLILSQPFSRNYERLVWVDLDVLINPNAPDVADGVQIDKVGAVDEYSIPTPQLHRETLIKLYSHWEATGTHFIRNPSAESYYSAFGLPHAFPQVVQTGVIVLSPAHHLELLEHVYHHYDDRGYAWNYEMRPLSYELLKAECVHWLDPRFNYIWGLYEALHFPFLIGAADDPRLAAALASAKGQTYFLHFAGSTNLMPAAAEVPADCAPPPAADPPQHAVGSMPEAEWTLNGTAVALFIFNRPELTERTLSSIRRARPPRLLIVADGPRLDHPSDAEACAAARAVVDRIDWPCHVATNFADTNLGLKRRIESGLTWVFSQCDEAIILEDDCLPDPAFFRFCEEMLERYRTDARVLSISGDNFQFGQRRGAGSYYFSRFAHIWGWATWRRAWTLYDPAMTQWSSLRGTGWLETVLGRGRAAEYWSYIFSSQAATRSSWDYAWQFAGWLHGGVHVLPNSNLVSNQGFGPDSTHTKDGNAKFAFMPTGPLDVPLIHPHEVQADHEADAFTEQIMFSGTLTQLFARIRKCQVARQGHDGNVGVATAANRAAGTNR